MVYCEWRFCLRDSSSNILNEILRNLSWLFLKLKKMRLVLDYKNYNLNYLYWTYNRSVSWCRLISFRTDVLESWEHLSEYSVYYHLISGIFFNFKNNNHIMQFRFSSHSIFGLLSRRPNQVHTPGPIVFEFEPENGIIILHNQPQILYTLPSCCTESNFGGRGGARGM